MTSDSWQISFPVEAHAEPPKEVVTASYTADGSSLVCHTTVTVCVCVQPEQCECITSCCPVLPRGSACDEEVSNKSNETCPGYETSQSENRMVERIGNFQVDSQILRGISLRRSLWQAGRLFRRSPLDLSEQQRGNLWQRSRRGAGAQSTHAKESKGLDSRLL